MTITLFCCRSDIINVSSNEKSNKIWSINCVSLRVLPFLYQVEPCQLWLLGLLCELQYYKVCAILCDAIFAQLWSFWSFFFFLLPLMHHEIFHCERANTDSLLEKILESPLDSKEIKPVNSKGNQSWILIGRTDAEAETPILRPPDGKNWLIGKKPWC